MTQTYSLRAKLWKWTGPSAWYFVTIPKKESAHIKQSQAQKPRRGWGSVPVEVRIGTSVWKTSIFPEKSGTYLLPVKASVRKVEGFQDADIVRFHMRLL